MASNYANYLGARRCCDLRGLGPQGAQGAIGAYGPIGPIGSQGLQGTTGFTGSQGTQGSQGPAGTGGRDSAYGSYLSPSGGESYTLNNPIRVNMTSYAPIVLGQAYAINVSVFVSSTTTTVSGGFTSSWNISSNIEPNTNTVIPGYVFPRVFKNTGGIGGSGVQASTPMFVSPYTSGSTTQFSACFSDFFVFNEPTIVAFNPFNINVYIGNKTALTNTVYTSGLIFYVTVTINPVSSTTGG